MVEDSKSNLWGGRFAVASDLAMQNISQSIHFDWRLAPYDLIQTQVHAQILLDNQILAASEFDELKKTLQIISRKIEKKEISYLDTDEDVHSAIERIITESLPAIGPKLRTGRSRNDQVATDLRLYVRDQNQLIVASLVALITEIRKISEQYFDLPSPGFTHLQHAQPVTLGHEFAKHCHALLRDCNRAIQMDHVIAVSPLGSGALAGSPFNPDVLKTAKLLNFNEVAANSLDAVSDRDFVAEFLFNLSMISVHLSRLAEEIILMTTSEFGYAKLHDSWSTGSSLMPQKKNPDIAELTRGKTGRFIGNLTSLLITLKALPFAYNRDLQEDKEPLFDSIDQMHLILSAMSGLVRTLTFDIDKLKKAAITNHAAATDVADYLVKKGIAFKVAHEIVGNLVLRADALNLDITELPLEEFQKAASVFQADIHSELAIQSLLNVRSSSLGTAPISVKQQLKSVAKSVQQITQWASDSLVIKL